MNKYKKTIVALAVFLFIYLLIILNGKEKKDTVKALEPNTIIVNSENILITKVEKINHNTLDSNQSIIKKVKEKIEIDLLTKILNNTNKGYIYDDIEVLIDSFNKDTNVINIVELLLANKRTKEVIIDMFPSFLSSEEFEVIFERNYNNFSDTEKQMILTMYANNSVINGSNPYDSSFMGGMIKENVDLNELSKNTQLFLSLEIDDKGNKGDSFADIHAESFASELIKKKPKTSEVTDLYYWLKSNLNIRDDSGTKSEFMINAMNQLSSNEKKELLEFAPNLTQYLE